MIKKGTPTLQNPIKLIFTFSLSSWINFVIGVLATVITTRIFEPEVYGLINIFNVTSGTLMSILCLGLDGSYIRFYHEPPQSNDQKQLVFKLLSISLFMVVIVGGLISIFFYPSFSEAVFGRTSWFLSVMVFASAFSTIVLRFLTITYRMRFNARQYTIQNILVQFVTKIFIVCAALINPNVETVVVFNVGGLFILTLVYLFLQRKDILPEQKSISLKGYGEVVKFAIFNSPTLIITNANILVSQLIIARTLNNEAVGIFASANVFVAILNVLKGGLGTYWSPFMYSNYKTEQVKIIKVHNYVMLTLLVVLAGLVIFKDLIYVMIGSNYHGSKEFFALLLVVPILSMAAETTAYGIPISKKNHLTLINNIIGVTVNLGACILLIHLWGLKGAALASCISAIIIFSLNTYFGQKYYISVESIKKTILGVVLIILMALATILISSTQFLIPFVILIVLMGAVLFSREVRIIVNLIKTKVIKSKVITKS